MADSRMGIAPASLSVCPKTTQIEREARREVTIADLLVWAYRDQQVLAAQGGSFLPSGPHATMSGMLASIGELGALVGDRGETAWVGEVDADPDARMVNRIVEALEPPSLSRLVKSRAALGNPADALAFAMPRLVPGRTCYDPDYQSGSKPWACELVVLPPIEPVLLHRAAYAAWRQALALLMVQFRARPWLLRRFTVTESLPAELPPEPAWWQAKPRMIASPFMRAEARKAWAQKRFDRQQRERRRRLLAEREERKAETGAKGA